MSVGEDTDRHATKTISKREGPRIEIEIGAENDLPDSSEAISVAAIRKSNLPRAFVCSACFRGSFVEKAIEFPSGRDTCMMFAHG